MRANDLRAKRPHATMPTNRPATKELTVIRGRGTANETRIATSVKLYWSNVWNMYMSIPED